MLLTPGESGPLPEKPMSENEISVLKFVPVSSKPHKRSHLSILFRYFSYILHFVAFRSCCVYMP